MQKICGVYTITNIINGKIYVGCSANIRKRWREHKNDLMSNRHKNIHLQNTWNKYGKDNFMFELLIECEERFLTSEEHYWCNILNVHDRNLGYNIQYTHPENSYGLSKETRIKISKKAIGRVVKKETVDKIQASRKGYVHSEETKKKISESNKGKIKSQEQIEKMRRTNIGRKHSPEAKEKMRISRSTPEFRALLSSFSKKSSGNKGIAKTIDSTIRSNIGRFGNRKIEIFNSDNLLVFTCNFQQEAADFLRISKALVMKVLTGCYKKTSKGYTLKYTHIQAA